MLSAHGAHGIVTQLRAKMHTIYYNNKMHRFKRCDAG